ncbi:hypothetical protein GQ55_1G242800 [Panicum hallii var. hallii]|uniref:Uncharacterized protein n=1 Tax=Panicum hallii var. hallii TaxID=1504633 RepID=A0A2T7F707_9POAL|nr:hypothetical protein GQ55_1G242800 [Panicum hallii var. hallii]
MEEKGRRRHKKDRRQTLLAEIEPIATKLCGEMQRRVHIHVDGPSHGGNSLLQSPRCLGRERSLHLEVSSEAVARHLRHGHRPPISAAALFFLSMPSIWLPRHRWFSRVETGNQQTTASCMWVHTGPAPTRARDQDDGSIWVGYGRVPGFAEPVNRAI